MHRGNKLIYGHVGDSRAVLARKGMGHKLEAHELTRDHKPTLGEEKRRIYQCGGEVRCIEGDVTHRVFVRARPYPGLSMSRALGDTIAASVGVIAEPEVKQYSITQGYDSFVLLCSDGV